MLSEVNYWEVHLNLHLENDKFLFMFCLHKVSSAAGRSGATRDSIKTDEH